MSAVDARKELAAVLKTALGTKWTVHPNEPTLTEVAKPTVTISRRKKTKRPFPGQAFESFEIRLVTPQNTTDDALDGYLDDLTEALEDNTYSQWETADRGVLADAFPMWVITITTISNREA